MLQRLSRVTATANKSLPAQPASTQSVPRRHLSALKSRYLHLRHPLILAHMLLWLLFDVCRGNSATPRSSALLPLTHSLALPLHLLFSFSSAPLQPRACLKHVTHSYLGQAKGVELEVAGVTLALDGLEEGDAAEDLEERGPQEDLGHAAGLDEHVVGLDGGQLCMQLPSAFVCGGLWHLRHRET